MNESKKDTLRKQAKELAQQLSVNKVELAVLISEIHTLRLWKEWGYDALPEYGDKELGLTKDTTTRYNQTGALVTSRKLGLDKAKKLGMQRLYHLSKVKNKKRFDEAVLFGENHTAAELRSFCHSLLSKKSKPKLDPSIVQITLDVSRENHLEMKRLIDDLKGQFDYALSGDAVLTALRAYVYTLHTTPMNFKGMGSPAIHRAGNRPS